jgi:hypothetical protein
MLEPVVIVGAGVGVVCGVVFSQQTTPGISLGVLGKMSRSNSFMLSAQERVSRFKRQPERASEADHRSTTRFEP